MITTLVLALAPAVAQDPIGKLLDEPNRLQRDLGQI